MGVSYNTSVVREGLVVYLDAANIKCYPGSGITFYNLGDSSDYGSINLFGQTSRGSVTNGVINISGASNNSSDGVILQGSGYLGNTVNSNFTSMGFIKRTSSKSGEILSYRQSSWRCSFDITDSAMYFYQRETISPYTTRYTSVSTNSELNQWYFYALVKSGNTFYFYKNEDLVGSTSFTISETIVGTSFYHIGGAWSDDDYLSNCMDGSIGPILHYTRALFQSEIQENFQALRGRFGL